MDIGTRDDLLDASDPIFGKVKPKEAVLDDLHASMFDGKPKSAADGRFTYAGHSTDSATHARISGDYALHTTLADLIEDERAIAATKHDVRDFPISELAVDVREKLTLDAKGRGKMHLELVLARGRSEGAPLTRRGVETLASYFDVPVSYINRLMDKGLNELAATNINTLIEHKTSRGAAVDTCTVRFIAEGDTTRLRCVASKDYGVINNLDVLEMFQEALTEWGGEGKVLVSNMDNDFDRIVANLYPADSMVTVRGDSDYGLGFSVKNSECLRSMLVFRPFLHREACMNGVIIDRHDGATFQQRHTGVVNRADFRHRMKVFIGAALGKSEALLELLLLNKQVEVNLPEAVIARLCKDHDLTRDQGKVWNSAWLKEQDYSGFGIVNALTAAAQYKDFTGEKREEMECLAGHLIAPSLSANLSAIEKRWGHINMLAAHLEEEEPEFVRQYALA